MQSRRIALAKEEILRIIEICESIERSGLDPFTVNVRELLQKLRRIVEENKDMDVIVLDAETLYKISVIISLQHRWLRERASNLFVDSQLVSAKIMAADPKELARCLARSWRPIVSGEQLTKQMVINGYEYFLSLPPRRGGAGEETHQAEVEEISGTISLKEFAEEEVLEEEMKRMHKELLSLTSEEPEINYWSFINREGVEKAADRAYVLAFLVSEGYAEIIRNAITGEMKIRPLPEKKRHESPTSLAITVNRRIVGGEGE